MDRPLVTAHPDLDYTPVLLEAVRACSLTVPVDFSWPEGGLTSPAQLSTAARSLGLRTAFLKLTPDQLRKSSPLAACTAIAFLTHGAILLTRESPRHPWPNPRPQEEWIGYLMTCEAAPPNVSEPDRPAPRPAGLDWFFGALTRHRSDFLWMLLASIFIQAAALTVPFMTMAVYDRVVPNGAMETLSAIAIGGVMMFLFDFIIRLLRGWFGDVAAKGVDQVLSSRLMEQTLRMEMSGRPASAGAFAARLRQYESVREFFTSATVTALVDLPMALLLTAVIFWLGGPVGWIPLIMAALAITQVLLFQPWLRRLMQRAHELGIDRQAITGEIVNGLEVIKAANAESVLASRVEHLEQEAAAADLKLRRLTQFSSNFTLLCVNLTTIATLVACVFLIGERAMSMGGMIACMMISGRAMAPLAGASGVLLRLQQMLTSLRSLRELMSLPREDDRVPLQRPLSFPMVRCDRVSFSYPGQPVPGLADISLTIQPGERVAIIGRAGSGKTTLLRLLSRLQTPSSGLVLLDGVDICQLDPTMVRQACAYLPQDPVLFHGTVRENILMGRHDRISDSQLLDAARRCGLLEWVNRHPLGFDLQVGERGVLLSGGQRQAVASARTLATEPDVLLLDEPAANLDLTSEKNFREALKDYLDQLPGRTLIFATHKMSMLALADRVILIEGGRLLADGPRDVVLARLATPGATPSPVSTPAAP